MKRWNYSMKSAMLLHPICSLVQVTVHGDVMPSSQVSANYGARTLGHQIPGLHFNFTNNKTKIAQTPTVTGN
jgi:hypothetical protein